MENKRGSEIFLGVIGVATLVVAILGATFAFFSASQSSNNDAISVQSATLNLQYVDTTGTLLKTHLIPAAENIATYSALVQTGTANASGNQCMDDNTNEVCSVYEFTVTNPSTTTSQDVTFTLNVKTNEFTNLVYKIYKGSASSLDTSSTAVVSKATFGTANSSTTLTLGNLEATQEETTNYGGMVRYHLGTTNLDNSVTYTMVIWIDETGGNQTTADAGMSFAAGLTVTSGSGAGVTGVIASATS